MLRLFWKTFYIHFCKISLLIKNGQGTTLPCLVVSKVRKFFYQFIWDTMGKMVIPKLDVGLGVRNLPILTRAVALKRAGVLYFNRLDQRYIYKASSTNHTNNWLSNVVAPDHLKRGYSSAGMWGKLNHQMGKGKPI